MKRWEFDSVEQASRCISSWFSGKRYERFVLQNYLDDISVVGSIPPTPTIYQSELWKSFP